MGLEQFPGYLGFTSQGVIAIHADWPAYPLEHGWQVAVISLGSFPQGTKFTRIDDIDQCALFLAQGYGKFEDPYDERAFHIAIWHEDLLEAHRQGFVEGVQPLTERENQERRYEALRDIIRHSVEQMGGTLPPGDPLSQVGRCIDGQWSPIALPSLDDYLGDEDEWLSRDWLETASTVHLTALGWSALDDLWTDAFEIPEQVRYRVEPLVEQGLYDTALRELSILIESRIRKITSSQAFGLKLVDEFMGLLISTGRFRNAGLKIVRSEIRTAFKFVRNEFAHNLVDLPKPRAYALLGRMCHVLEEVDEIACALVE